MPEVKYDDARVSKFLGGGSQIIRLKNKGDSVDFVLASPFPNMVGRHWIDRRPSFCPRINLDKECLHCKEYFELRKMIKKTEDKDEKKRLEKKADDLKVKIKFYYKIVVLGGSFDKGGYILEVPATVYVTFKGYVKKGINIEEQKWSIERTEESPANYYSLINLGPASFDEEEAEWVRAEADRVRDVDVDALLGLSGSKVASSGIEEETEEEEVDVDKIDEEIDQWEQGS